MKIFFFFSVLHKLYCEIAKELCRQDPEAEFCGILSGPDQLRDLQQNNFPSQELCVFTEELRRQLPHAQSALDLLVRWEKKHDVSLSRILSTDRRYHTFPRDEGLRIAAVAITVCETWLKRTKPDVIVAAGINDLLSHVLYYSARERGIPYLITYASPTPNRVAIYSNPDNHWETVEDIFFHLKGRSITPQQRASAASLIRAYREKHLLPSYLKAGFNRLFSGRELHSFWKIFRKRWLEPAHRLNPNYGGGVSEVIYHKLMRTFRAKIFSPQHFQWQERSDPFVFFPLQLEPECSTLVFAPFHANQLYVIECLSKSLPIDHLLYVKEHPAMLGRRPLSFFRALQSLPNVKLISPRVSSHTLIQRANAVATITSSVGWEALMHAKPVIVLGNVWFDACDLVSKVRATEDLPAALQRALFDHQPDEELLLKFVTASLEGTYPGQIENPDYTPGVLSPRNAAAIANAICRHLQWLGFPSLEQQRNRAVAANSISGGEERPTAGLSGAAGVA